MARLLDGWQGGKGGSILDAPHSDDKGKTSIFIPPSNSFRNGTCNVLQQFAVLYPYMG